MKCKRCRAEVPDTTDSCPYCGQDLTSLRQLLKIFDEEPIQSNEPASPPSEPVIDQPLDRKELPSRGESPRVTIEAGPPKYRDFPLTHSPKEEGESSGEEEKPALEDVPKGGFWIRLMALVIDHIALLMILGIFIVVGFLALQMGSGGLGQTSYLEQATLILPTLIPLSVVLAAVYFTYLHGAWGRTIGKMILGLRVVRTDGQNLTYSRALVRTFAYAVSALPFFLGFLWVCFNKKKRGLHDLIAGTEVVRD